MTLPPEKIGDKGQRYEVRGVLPGRDEKTGDDAFEVMGWTSDPTGGSLLDSAMAWPRFKTAYVFDREADPGAIAQMPEESSDA